jgi:hypothetical protein
MDINKATKVELETLPQIGDARSLSIIKARADHQGKLTPEIFMAIPEIPRTVGERLINDQLITFGPVLPEEVQVQEVVKKLEDVKLDQTPEKLDQTPTSSQEDKLPPHSPIGDLLGAVGGGLEHPGPGTPGDWRGKQEDSSLFSKDEDEHLTEMRAPPGLPPIPIIPDVPMVPVTENLPISLAQPKLQLTPGNGQHGGFTPSSPGSPVPETFQVKTPSPQHVPEFMKELRGKLRHIELRYCHLALREDRLLRENDEWQRTHEREQLDSQKMEQDFTKIQESLVHQAEHYKNLLRVEQEKHMELINTEKQRKKEYMENNDRWLRERVARKEREMEEQLAVRQRRLEESMNKRELERREDMIIKETQWKQDVERNQRLRKEDLDRREKYLIEWQKQVDEEWVDRTELVKAQTESLEEAAKVAEENRRLRNEELEKSYQRRREVWKDRELQLIEENEKRLEEARSRNYERERELVECKAKLDEQDIELHRMRVVQLQQSFRVERGKTTSGARSFSMEQGTQVTPVERTSTPATTVGSGRTSRLIQAVEQAAPRARYPPQPEMRDRNPSQTYQGIQPLNEVTSRGVDRHHPARGPEVSRRPAPDVGSNLGHYGTGINASSIHPYDPESLRDPPPISRSTRVMMQDVRFYMGEPSRYSTQDDYYASGSSFPNQNPPVYNLHSARTQDTHYSYTQGYVPPVSSASQPAGNNNNHPGYFNTTSLVGDSHTQRPLGPDHYMYPTYSRRDDNHPQEAPLESTRRYPRPPPTNEGYGQQLPDYSRYHGPSPVNGGYAQPPPSELSGYYGPPSRPPVPPPAGPPPVPPPAGPPPQVPPPNVPPPGYGGYGPPSNSTRPLPGNGGYGQQPASQENENDSRRDFRSRNNSRTFGQDCYRRDPKLAEYHGTIAWRAYEAQMDVIAEKYGWSDDERLDKLVQALRGKALMFYGSQTDAVRRSYNKLVGKLNNRFEPKDPPRTAKRVCNAISQLPDEKLEELAERAQRAAYDAWGDVSEEVANTVAMDTFLLAVTDYESARYAMDKDPTNMDEALKFVRKAVHDKKALSGSKSSKIRAVQFAENPVKEKASVNVEALQKQVESQASKMDEILGLLKKSPYSPRYSPRFSPRRSNTCYNCGKEGHFANKCPEPPKPRGAGRLSSPARGSPSQKDVNTSSPATESPQEKNLKA